MVVYLVEEKRELLIVVSTLVALVVMEALIVLAVLVLVWGPGVTGEEDWRGRKGNGLPVSSLLG